MHSALPVCGGHENPTSVGLCADLCLEGFGLAVCKVHYLSAGAREPHLCWPLRGFSRLNGGFCYDFLFQRRSGSSCA